MHANGSRFPVGALHILALWAVAVGQPIFDLLQSSPEFFVAHDAGPVEILTVVLALIFLVPLVLGAVIWAAGVYVLRAVVAILAAAIAIQIAKHAGVQSASIGVPLAATAGVAAAYAYSHSAAVRSFTTVLSLAALAVPLVFVTRPGIKQLVFPSQQATAAEGTPDRAETTSAPVVMVISDETPIVSLVDAEGKIDPVLYPNMARLARDGVWFRNATAVADFTRWAVPSILSGKYPERQLLPTAADHPDNLFILLGRTHQMEVTESVTRLCPRDVCRPSEVSLETRLEAVARDLSIIYLHILFPDDLRTRLPALTSGWARFGTEEAVRRRREQRATEPRPDKYQIAVAFANRISREDRQPTFYFFHTLLPHSPWEWLPSGQRNATRTAVPGDQTWSWTDDEWGVAQYYQRHLLQIGLVDTALGRIIERLEAAGLYDRAVIVVTADHGIAFHPGTQRRSFTERTAADIMRVPLFVKTPSNVAAPVPDAVIGGQRISDRNVETIDIAPTIAQAVGLELPWKTDGQSLLDTTKAPRSSKRMYFASAQRVREYGAEGPAAAPAVQRKLDMFGGPENVYRVPRPARYGELVGRPLAGLRIEDSGGDVSVEHLSQFENINPRAEMIPFDVAGEIRNQRPQTSPTYVAVAVNGTVRAVTRTWSSEPRKWLATPPLDSWRAGSNELQVFIVDSDSHGPFLRRTRLV